jgi:CRP/FNR family cyclic AMP-dependent transcriptional regulator
MALRDDMADLPWMMPDILTRSATERVPHPLNWRTPPLHETMPMFRKLLEQQPNVITVPAGAPIFREGDRGNVMFGVIRGEVDIFIGNVILEIVGPGMVFGEMALIDDEPRSASASARTDCQLVQIDVAAFEILVASNPGFARQLMKIMAGRLRHMNSMVMEASSPAGQGSPAK